MKVFNLFLKLARNHKVSMIFGIILIVFFVYPAQQGTKGQSRDSFQAQDFKMTIFDHDKGPVSQALVTYLEQRTELVPMEENVETIADGLFYSFTDYVLTIPEGYSDQVLAKKDFLPLEKKVTKGGAYESYIDSQIKTFLTSLDVMRLTLPNQANDAQVAALLEQVLAENQVDIQVTIQERGTDEELALYGQFYIGYMLYVFLLVFITVFGKIILAMRNPEITKREWMSKLTEIVV